MLDGLCRGPVNEAGIGVIETTSKAIWRTCRRYLSNRRQTLMLPGTPCGEPPVARLRLCRHFTSTPRQQTILHSPPTPPAILLPEDATLVLGPVFTTVALLQLAVD